MYRLVYEEKKYINSRSNELEEFYCEIFVYKAISKITFRRNALDEINIRKISVS